jgi:transposase
MMERKRPRRRWSKDEKRAIVEETEFPEASVAEVALRHEINANLLFRWRQEFRTEAESVKTKADEDESVQDTPDNSSLEFVPVGVFTHGDDGGAALSSAVRTSVEPQEAQNDDQPRYRLPPPPKLDQRPGVIEVDLPGDVRIRVDSFVNQQAFQRVLKALKALS